MPAKMALKEHRASWAQERKYVLEIRGGARRGTERRRIERATSHRQHQHTRDPLPISKRRERMSWCGTRSHAR